MASVTVTRGQQAARVQRENRIDAGRGGTRMCTAEPGQRGNGVTSGVLSRSIVSANALDRLGKNIMIPGTTLPTPYEKRLKLVQDTMTTYSVLDDDAAGKLAVHVLHALDSIPETIR